MSSVNNFLVLIQDQQEPIRINYRIVSTRKTGEEIAEQFISNGRNVIAVYRLTEEYLKGRKEK